MLPLKVMPYLLRLAASLMDSLIVHKGKWQLISLGTEQDNKTDGSCLHRVDVVWKWKIKTYWTLMMPSKVKLCLTFLDWQNLWWSHWLYNGQCINIFFSPFLMLLVFKIVQKPDFPTLFLEFILQLQCDASEIDHWLQKVEYYLPQFLAFIDQKDKALIPMQLFISLLKSKCLGNVHKWCPTIFDDFWPPLPP